MTETFVGKLCNNGHRHLGKPKSLRYSNRGACAECVKERASEWQRKNKLKVCQNTKNWRENNPEKRKESIALWAKDNREKINAKTAKRRANRKQAAIESFTSDDLIRRFRKAFNCQCAYCLKPLVYKKVQWDHIIPLASKGEHSLRNLAPSCQKCNNAKRDKPVLMWLKDCDRPMNRWLFDLLTEEWFILAYAESVKSDFLE